MKNYHTHTHTHTVLLPHIRSRKRSYLDHPIHPPTETSDPWDIEFPVDKTYCIRAVDGVFNVFQDEVNFKICINIKSFKV